MADTLPEGTDHILPGASGTERAEDTGSYGAASGGSSTRERLKSEAGDLRDKVQGKAEEFKTQAGDKARDYAEQGKERASGALSEVARLITENAAQIDDKVGAQYGDYARRAAGAVSGAADSLRERDIDELIEDARGLIRKSPAIAIGAAAAAGFLLARIIKSGSEALQESAAAAAPVETSNAAPKKTSKSKAPSAPDAD